MSAADKLRALDEAMTPGPWYPEPPGTPTVFACAYDDSDCEGMAALRNALAWLIAVVEAAESVVGACSYVSGTTDGRSSVTTVTRDAVLEAALVTLRSRLVVLDDALGGEDASH